jgi:diguanylate cyclase (GGDEF)-like protein/PAS domain S-box-containing protein
METDMRITSRIFIISLSFSLIIMLSCVAFFGWFFLDYTWRSEQSTIAQRLDAAGFYLEEHNRHFQKMTNEFADTFARPEQAADFAPDAEYFLGQLDFSDHEIHLAAISNQQARLLAGVYLEDTAQTADIPNVIADSLEQNIRLMLSGQGTTFYLSAEEAVYLIALTPLLIPGADQPETWLILGRRMDQNLYDRLFVLTRLSYSMTGQWPEEHNREINGNGYYTVAYNRLLDDQITAYQQLQDEPLILLRLTNSREAYLHQLTGLIGFMLVLIAFASILIIIVLLLINQRILIPIENFTDHVSRLDFTSFEPFRFSRKASSELHLLGQTINQLMETIRDEQEQLQHSESYLRTLFLQSPIGIVVGNLAQPINDANPSFCRLVGREREQLLQLRLADITHPDDLGQKKETPDLLADPNTGVYQLQKRYLRPDGSAVWVHVTAAPLADLPDQSDQNLYMVLDISCSVARLAALRESERKKSELLQRDVLTGIFNRRYFEQALLEAQQQGELPLSLMIGDINGLKLVNDAFGHQSGDMMIIQAARVLQSCCREKDILARTGGDEFIMILPGTGDSEAYKIMKEIKQVCDRHNSRIRDEELHISISLGYATRTDLQQPMTEVLETAEDYMRKHKLVEKRSQQSTIVDSILATLYERSQETEEHAHRLAVLAQKIGEKLALTQLELDQLILLARLHDIGKINISRQILNKPGKLTAQEWAEMRQHPEIGYRLAIASPQLLSIAELILTHHEHWDGGGYPQGLSGEAIPLLSRIIALVDAYDVMTQDRPYRKAISRSEALDEIRRCAGSQFDPRITGIFIELVSDTE